MEKIVLWGAGKVGRNAFDNLVAGGYDIKAYGDNDVYKQGLTYKGVPVISFEKFLHDYSDCNVIVSMQDYYVEASRLNENGICVFGYYDLNQKKVLPWERLTWGELQKKKKICLYAGDIYENFDKYPDDYVICLSLTNSDYRTIKHDITEPYPLEANSIDCYQIEDVIEHIEKEKVVQVLNEIYRILKKDGYLRLSLPDYHSPYLLYNSFVDSQGKPVYDPNGGGQYIGGNICGGGHVWFPTYELVKELLEESAFQKFKFYRYHDVYGKDHVEEIDYGKGYIYRTKENADYKEDHSIVVDCYK